MESIYFPTLVVGVVLTFLFGGWVAKPLAGGLHDIASAIREYAKVLETKESRELTLETERLALARAARLKEEEETLLEKILEKIGASERALLLKKILGKDHPQTIYEAVTLGLLWVEYYEEYWGGESWRKDAGGKKVAENLFAATLAAGVTLEAIPSLETHIPEWVKKAESLLYSARAKAISGN